MEVPRNIFLVFLLLVSKCLSVLLLYKLLVVSIPAYRRRLFGLVCILNIYRLLNWPQSLDLVVLVDGGTDQEN